MPHTNRRKKREDGRKRVEVLDEEGWTRVTTKHQAKEMAEPHPVTGKGYDPSQKPVTDPYAHDTALPGRTEAPPGATVEAITQNYEKIKKLWLSSGPCAALQSSIRSHLPPTTHRVQNCTLFGSGSYCGLRHGWIGRQEVALLQTAVFATAVDLIDQLQGSRPKCFAQEPLYNSVDKAFLAATLGITALDDPEAFEQLPQHSFVYAPGAEHTVLLRLLYRLPRLLLASEVGSLYYRDSYGLAHPKYEDAGLAGSPEGESTRRESRQEDKENDARVCERFLHDRGYVRLPDLEWANYPFHRQLLYYHSEPEEP